MNSLITDHPVVSEVDNDKRTCLHAAACGGNIECVDLMITEGCQINAKDKMGRTPVHYAAATAQYQCLLSLVANGANLTVVDNVKRTPLHYAAAADAEGNCISHLLRSFSGATPFTTDSKGFTLLHYAACYGHRMSVQIV
jgi:serine/threonine-protein phosphatase 6 regulatory ankyrin repeat subunit A